MDDELRALFDELDETVQSASQAMAADDMHRHGPSTLGGALRFTRSWRGGPAGGRPTVDNARSLRVSMRPAVAMSCLGLIADLAYFQMDIATRFLLIDQWAVGLAYAAASTATTAWLVTIGWSRAKAAMNAARREDSRG